MLYGKSDNMNSDNIRTKVLSMLFFVVVCGIIFGTLLFFRTGRRELLLCDFFSNGFIKTSGSKTLAEVFLNSFGWTAFILIVLFVSGFSSVCQPVEIMTLFYRGMTIGISASFTYSEYGKKGAAVVLLMILPYAVTTTAVIVFAVRESLRLSNTLLWFASGQASEEKYDPSVRMYLIRFAVLLFIILLLSAADCAAAFYLSDKLISNY